MQNYKIQTGNTIFEIIFQAPSDNGDNISEYAKDAVKLHYHSAYEIFFAVGSPLNIFTIDENLEVNDSIVIIPPFINHYAICSDNILRFTFQIGEKNKSCSNLFGLFKGMSEENKLKIFHASDKITGNAAALSDALKFKTPTDVYKIQPLLSLIFLNIADLAVQKNYGEHKRDVENHQSNISAIDRIISLEYKNDINLTYLSEKIHLSARQTARIIKKNYNQSFSVLLLNRRLTVAAMLLSTSDMKISQIIEKTGFQTNNYFFSTFRKKYGVTPLAYRRGERDYK